MALIRLPLLTGQVVLQDSPPHDTSLGGLLPTLIIESPGIFGIGSRLEDIK
jgi:hypothetical protein